MRNIVEGFAELPAFIRKPLWRLWHRYLLRKVPNENISCLNYGYADLDVKSVDNGHKPDPWDERFGTNLYYQTVVEANIKGKDVLEVGCGRGGGAKFLVQKFNPNHYVATDLSPDTTKQNALNNDNPSLEFAVADAMNLPFEDSQYDILVNVESSRCYPDMAKFVNEAFRVLKPGGIFCLADMRYKDEYQSAIQTFLDLGFTKVLERDITPNVVHALNLDDERRKLIISMTMSKSMLKSANEFSGTVGSRRYNLFANGDMLYKIIHFKKPELGQ